jgi:hypothetical protein
MTELAAIDVLEMIQKDIVKNNARRQDVRLVDGVKIKLEPGDVIQQGDIYLTYYPIKEYPKSRLGSEIKDTRQIVPSGIEVKGAMNDGERGSQHVVLPGPKIFNRKKKVSDLQGPIIMAPEGLYLSHPEHPHDDIRQPGVFEVHYQQDKAFAEREARRRAD